MHEGLLIVSKSTYQFLFCNKAAQKLISQFLGPIEKCYYCQEPLETERIQQDILKKETISAMKFKNRVDEEK